MSEYQYYEFQTVGHRLTGKEMQELRGCSSRARITPTSFANEYNFGSFKGNADAWMENYFDGFLHLANWGTRELQLALPAKLLPLETARRYCSSQAASSREKSGKLIFKFLLNEEPGGEWLEGEGNLASLLPIRDELAHGDLRSLYLGWLMRAQAGDLNDADLEPPVPPNLGDLSGPQANFVDFFHLDPNLLAVAAKNSPSLKAEPANRDEWSSWIASLPVPEKDELLVRLMAGDGVKIGMELQSRFHRRREAGASTAGQKPRTVAELLAAAQAQEEERRREEQQRIAQEKKQREQQAAIARKKHLNSLKGRAETVWGTVETLTATRLPQSYDLAVQNVLDLRELAEREGGQEQFKMRLDALRSRHSAKRSLLDRLAKAGL